MAVETKWRIVEELTIIGPCREVNPIVTEHYKNGFRLVEGHVHEDGSEVCEYVIEREIDDKAVRSGGGEA